MEMKTVFAIGRWMPIHLGHKSFLVKLAREFDRLIIGIGSCYENGTPRNCIPAIEREKLLLKMLKAEGITNVTVIPVQDRPTFEEWIGDVCAVCEKFGVTHFCTGNKEDILDVMERMNITLDVEMINPEDGSDFPYHATDVRRAIIENKTELIDAMIPNEIKEMVLGQVSKEIKLSAKGQGQEFIPGRQTVDTVFTVFDITDNKNYLLIGKRNSEKIDFPSTWAIPGGGILEFESPINAAVRCFKDEAGIEITVKDNSCEPAIAHVNELGIENAELYFTGIYASHDERINGTRGGGSQCFAINVRTLIKEVKKHLCSHHDMTELKLISVDEVKDYTLAYDQKRMVYEALTALRIPFDKGEMLEVFSESGEKTGRGVSRKDAHREGVLHGASHIYITKREKGEIYILLQRRSANKDSFPLCLDISSAGHIEMGSDFLETAKRELFEELGIVANDSDLTELFVRQVSINNEFYGEKFIDNEINKIYILNFTPKIEDLKLQKEEVYETVWLSAREIIERVKQGDKEICIEKDELFEVINKLEGDKYGY